MTIQLSHRPSELLELVGWVSGDYVKAKNGQSASLYGAPFEQLEGFCMLGVVYRAFGPDHENEAEDFKQLLYKEISFPVTWQDDPARTKEEVVAVLKKAEAVYFKD